VGTPQAIVRALGFSRVIAGGAVSALATAETIS
jgi:hypothetical protein